MIAGGGGVLCNRCNVKGFRFQPTDEELVDHHLIPKILDPDSDQHYIADVDDLTQFEPIDLFGITQKSPDDREGYFFWPPTYKNGKISRKGKNGFWSETRGCVSIDSAAAVDAKKRVFVFREGVYPGTRTAWFIHQFELELELTHQDKKDIFFLCKLFEQKDRDSSNKRKAEHNEQETSAKPKRATKDNTSRKKAKVSSSKEAQLQDEHNNTIQSSEVLHGSQSLPSEPDSSIVTGDQWTPQSHHLSSKVASENFSNNILAGDHLWSPGGLHPSNEISNNEDLEYNEQGKEGSQLSFQFPLYPTNDIIISELFQESHHLPSSCKETTVGLDAYQENQSKIPSPEGFSWDCMDEDANHYCGLSMEELEAPLEKPQPSTTAEVRGCNEWPPSSDLSRGADKFLDQCGNSEEDNASFWAKLCISLDL